MNNKNTILIMLIVFLILVIVIGTVLYVFSINSNKQEDKPNKFDKNIVMYPFKDPFLSNVKESRKILKVKIQLEVANEKTNESVKARDSEIRDKVNLILREKKEEDLSGANGQLKLQKEILTAVRNILNTDKIYNVYFDEFIVQ